MIYDNISFFAENDIAYINNFENAFINNIISNNYDHSILYLINKEQQFQNSASQFTYIRDTLIIQNNFENISENLSDNIYCYNDLFEKIDISSTHDKTFDIDVSYYSKSKSIQYMFYFDFLSELYSNFLKFIEINKVISTELLFDYEFTIKFRYLCINDRFYNINLYQVSDISNDLDILRNHQGVNKDYITVKFKIKDNYNFDLPTNNSNQFKDYTIHNIDNITEINKIKFISYIENAINKIDLKPYFNFNKNNDKFFYYGKILLYKYYKFIFSYTLLHIAYYPLLYKPELTTTGFIQDPVEVNNINKYNKRNKFIRGRELYNIYLIYKSISFNFQYSLEATHRALNDVIRIRPLSNQIQVETADKQLNIIYDLNSDLDDNKDNIKFEKTKYDYKNNIINDNYYFLYFTIAIILINLFIYLFVINIYNYDTSKFISFITLFITLSIYILFNSLYNFNIEYFTDDEYQQKIANLKNSGYTIPDLVTNLADPNSISTTTQHQKTDTSSSIYDEDYIAYTAPPVVPANFKQQIMQAGTIENKIIKYQEAIDQYTDPQTGTLSIIDNDIKRFETAISNLKSELDELQSSISSLQGKQTDKIKELEKYRSLLNDYKSAKSQYEELKRNRVDMLRYVIEYKTKLETENIKYAALKLEYLSKEKLVESEKQKLLDDISHIQDEIDDLNSDIKTLSNEVSAKNIEYATNKAILSKEYENLVKNGVEVATKLSKLNTLIDEIDAETTIYHQYTQTIIDIQKEFQNEALQAQLESSAIQMNTKKTIDKINEELTLLDDQSILTLEIKLNTLSFDNLYGSDIVKQNAFKTQIKLDLNQLLNVSLNRIDIIEVKSGSIIVIFNLYSKKIFSEDSSAKIYRNFRNLLSNQNMDPKFYKTKYLLYIETLKVIQHTDVPPGKEIVSQNELISSSLVLELNQGKYNSKILIESTNDLNEIKDILDIIDIILKTPPENRSYYTEMNKLVDKEITKYENINTNISHQLKIVDKNNNIITHNFIKNNHIYKLLLDISLLISFLFVGHTVFNKYVFIVYLIIIIIFIYLITNYFLNIKKNIRTKANNIYWKKPNKHLN